jgi:phosphate-selective porin OprO and OprP
MLAVVLLAGAARLAAEGGESLEFSAEETTKPPEEPPKPAPKPNPSYIEGRGFDFRTSDGLFDLAIGANLQVRFSDLDVDGPGSSTEFRVRRFKFYLTGFAFDPRLTYRFQLAFENANNVRLLDDAWLNWKFVDLFQVQAGQSKTPYGRQELMNDGVLMFAERSIAIDAFKPNRDAGVMAIGYSKGSVFQYAAGVFGGAGQTTLRGTNHVMPIARVVWSTFGDPRAGEPDLDRSAVPKLSIGANGFFNTLRKTTATTFESAFPSYASATGWLGQNVGLFETDEDVEVGSGGIDTQFAWLGFTFQGEYLIGHAKGVTSGVNLNSRGYYAQVSAMTIGCLGLALRYSSIDSNRAVTRDQQSEINAAATYYFRRHNVKLLGEYSTLHRQRAGAPANDHFVRVQVQLYM